MKGKTSGLKSKANLKRAFFARPAWQRFSVVIAGVVMNFILAAVIFYIFLGLSGFRTELPKIANQTFFAANVELRSDIIIGQVAKGSPAEKAGVKVPSSVVAVDGKKLTSADDLINTTKKEAGSTMTITLKDLATQKDYTVSIIPRVNPPEGEGAIGVAFAPYEIYLISYDSLVQKIFSGITYPVNLMAYNVNVIGKLVSASFKQGTVEPVRQGVSGPVGVYNVVNQVLQIDDFGAMMLQVLNLAGLISITLAFFNVLPIPALDGGRLFFILIEMVTTKKINPKYEAMIHAAGLVVLLSLMVLVTISDIFK